MINIPKLHAAIIDYYPALKATEIMSQLGIASSVYYSIKRGDQITELSLSKIAKAIKRKPSEFLEL